MMNRVQIIENENLSLDLEHEQIAHEMKKNNQNLPFSISNHMLSFDSYTVGTVCIGDLIIEVLPRNSSFNLGTIFNMILFNNDIYIESQHTNGYDFISDSGFMVVPKYFISLCEKLVKFGLTGEFINFEETSKRLNGDLLLEKYNTKLIRNHGFSYRKVEYSLNVLANQIIKTALVKINRLLKNSDDAIKLGSILKSFTDIEINVKDLREYTDKKFIFTSSNPYYPEALKIAITIINDMKVSYCGGKIQWYSFLQNSNNLFETYVRKLVSNTTKLNVQKWAYPKPYGNIVYNGAKADKSYSPDILIDYKEQTNTAKIVLDVKNKKFDPNTQNISELVESSDMYQILFYCRKLKTNLGGLIYPTNKDYDPIVVNINDDNDLRVVLLSVNMNLNSKQLIVKLKKDLYQSLYRYI